MTSRMIERHLLIVDDDPAFCQVLAAAFTRRGWSVDTACCKADALNFQERNYTHVIVDLRIGEDSGMELIEPIRARQPLARILVVTGYSSIATAVEAIKLGADNYLAKPVGTQEILASLLDEHVPSDVVLSESVPSVERLEWEHIQRVLAQYQGNISATARALGMHRRTLQRKLAKKPVRR